MKLKKKKSKWKGALAGVAAIGVACAVFGNTGAKKTAGISDTNLQTETAQMEIAQTETAQTETVQTEPVQTEAHTGIDTEAVTEKLFDENGNPIYPDGSVYEGDLKENLRDGEGTFTYASGEVYQGDWKNDAIEGTGVYTFTDGSRLVGEFLDNQFQTGSFEYEDEEGAYKIYIENAEETGEAEAILHTGERYKGYVENGSFTGECSVWYADGDSYSGQIEEGKKSGEGIYTWEDGAHYEGAWLDDAMNGEGAYYYTTEAYPYLKGSFENNKPVNECMYYKSAEIQCTTVWSNGLCTEIKE